MKEVKECLARTFRVNRRTDIFGEKIKIHGQTERKFKGLQKWNDDPDEVI